MTAVPWSMLSPEQIEHLVSVLLGRARKWSVRIRPSQGDGGIDVLDPLEDGRVDVYQIKSFTGSMTPSRRRQVANSLRRAADNPRVRIRDWYLVVPIRPSPEELVWFNDLVAAVGLAGHWFDADRLDGLAAAHQDVIDCYLHDGRQRLQESIDQLRALAGIAGHSEGRLLAPSDIGANLTALYGALNRDDPHYRYEFEVTADPPPASHLVERPWLVASCTQSDGTVAVTHHVFARYRMATEDAPVPLAFTVQRGRMDNATAQQWERALRYGTPVELPAGTVTDAHFGLPGGLAASPAEVAMSLSAAHDDEAKPYRLRLRLVDEAGALVAESVVAMQPVTRGILGGGVRAHGTEVGGAFHFEILMDVAKDGEVGPVRFNLSVGDLAGLPPAQLRSGIRFLQAFHRPSRLQFAPEYGPAAADTLELPVDTAPVTHELGELIEALADLQELLAGSLVVPDLEELTARDVRELLRAARLVRGETVRTTWTKHTMTMDAPVRPVEGPVQLALSGSHRVAVGDQVIVLDPVTTVLLAAELTETSRGHGVSVEARPALGNDSMLLRMSSIDDMPPQPVNA